MIHKNIELFILLGYHMWFWYKDTLFSFKVKANIYPFKYLPSVDDRNIYNNFFLFFETYIAGSHCTMQHCSTPELLIPKSDSVHLGEPPHITASTLQGHFTLLLQFQWHQILYSTYEWIMWHLSFSTWLISLRTMISCSFHFKQWGFIFSVVVYYVVFHHIRMLWFPFPLMKCFYLLAIVDSYAVYNKYRCIFNVLFFGSVAYSEIKES